MVKKMTVDEVEIELDDDVDPAVLDLGVESRPEGVLDEEALKEAEEDDSGEDDEAEEV